jgi:hypothetical protein
MYLMKTKAIISTLAASAAVFVNVPAFCQTQPTGGMTPIFQASQIDTLQILATNTDNIVMENAAYTLANDRQAVISQTMYLLTAAGSSSDRKGNAAIVLGEYRAKEAAAFLAMHFAELDASNTARGFYVSGSTMGISGEDRHNRAAAALKKIGVASIPPLLSRVADSDDAELTRKCLTICTAIEEPEIIGFRVQRLIEKETDSKRKARLEAALQTLKKPK